MTKITTPASLDDAKTELVGLSELLTATEWHRAAIVATYVRLDLGRGGRKMVSTDHFLSARSFAELAAEHKIRGLGSHNTVTFYVQCWLDEHDQNYPAPGQPLVLPETPWPPQQRNKGTRATAESIGRQMAADPRLAEAAAQALADGIIDDVEPETTRKLARASGERAVRDSGATVSPSRLSDRGKTPEELGEEAYWAKVADAFHVLLDVKVKMAEGVVPPAHIQILMQILAPEQDWDQAVRDEIGNIR